MKKLFALSFAVALMAPVFAEEENITKIERSEGRTLDVVETDQVVVDEAWWPAFFAVGEWPETPDLVGIRLTIPFATKQECVTGVDVGLWGRAKDFEGAQLNLIRNDVQDTFGGVQVGFYNSVNRGDMFGGQGGLWNEANSFRGIQLGLVNLTGDGQGVQVGLINRAETLYGFQIGIINVIRDAEIPVFPIVNVGF